MPRTRKKGEGINPVDIQVGGKVKSRRLMLGMSQEELASGIGITFQQVQKYERGTNRISVSRLVGICKVLRTPLDFFLEGCVPDFSKPLRRGVSDTKQAVFESNPLAKKDILDLIRAYDGINSPQMKKQLIEMAKAMGKSDKK